MSGPSLQRKVAQIKNQGRDGAWAMKDFIAGNYPATVQALRAIDIENTRPKRKGFGLVKRQSKKHGFLYYCRFSHNGRMLPTKWNTHTNNLELAMRYARDNKSRLVDRYLKSREVPMHKLLEGFYDGSQKLSISDRCRREYRSIIVNSFVPFLRSEKISNFGQITAATLSNYQDHLSESVKPQSVNNKLKAVRKVFAHLARKGIIDENPAERVRWVPVGEADKEARGCYELDRLKGVFNRRWRDGTSYLLALLIYTTGMRNGEIRRLRKEDIALVDGVRFISIEESKTANGIRLVPLHDFVYRKLCARAAGKGQPIFDQKKVKREFSAANAELARQLKASDEELRRERITFYSGRHFWKTLMSREGLGEDVEEVFMGHKVSGNVAKLYNHRDKMGKRHLAKKARQVFSILDRCLLKTKP